MYKVVGHENLIAAAGRSFGAKPVNTNSIITRKHHHDKFSLPNKQFLRTPKFHQRPTMYTQPPDTEHRPDEAHFQHDTQVPGGAEDLY